MIDIRVCKLSLWLVLKDASRDIDAYLMQVFNSWALYNWLTQEIPLHVANYQLQRGDLGLGQFTTRQGIKEVISSAPVGYVTITHFGSFGELTTTQSGRFVQ